MPDHVRHDNIHFILLAGTGVPPVPKDLNMKNGSTKMFCCSPMGQLRT
jgi:hypothetical protein